jgi:hypothetical protein
MFNYFQKLLNFLFGLNTESTADHPIVDNKLCIQFCLNEKNKLEILCDIPYEKSLSDNELIEISEKYAELLLGVSHGLFRNQIIETLKTESKNTEDHQKILLIDNIMSFYEILKQESLKSSIYYNSPVVAPSAVFSDKT